MFYIPGSLIGFSGTDRAAVMHRLVPSGDRASTAHVGTADIFQSLFRGWGQWWPFETLLEDPPSYQTLTKLFQLNTVND